MMTLPCTASKDVTREEPANAEGIAVAAQRRLRRNPYLALRDLSCEFRDGILFLRGLLPSYYLKQRAQEAVADLAGVRRIVNDIEITSGIR
ncbi:MAG: BON domain-containing protein [Gemmataceae bacterium]|nr:BON domain-containing protein [Gemmataceae bacterium]